MAEEKDIAFADFLGDLNVCTIDRAKQQSSVEAELHVRTVKYLASEFGVFDWIGVN